MAATALPGIAQFLPHPRTAEHAIVLGMQLPHALHQPSVLPRADTQWSCHPAIIATGRDSQTAAHQSDGKRSAASLDHPKLHVDAFAKNAAAARKKSRSLVTRASSRRNWLSSSSREHPLPTKACWG